MPSDFILKPQYLSAVRWSSRGSCGEPGCTDQECCCALCGLPIGVSEEDPRWEEHDELCGDCDLCRDQVPLILFRGEGKQMKQAQFHTACFQKIVHFRSRIESTPPRASIASSDDDLAQRPTDSQADSNGV